jgi:hypothetical protein
MNVAKLSRYEETKILSIILRIDPEFSFYLFEGPGISNVSCFSDLLLIYGVRI